MSPNSTSFEETWTCMRCGLCLAKCPTYQITSMETFGPRGRIALLRASSEGKVGGTKELSQFISSCLGCLACTTVCPSGVRVNELVSMAKGEPKIVRPASFLKRIVLEDMVPFPERLEWFLPLLHLYHKAGLPQLIQDSRIASFLPDRWKTMGLWSPHPSPQPLRKRLEDVSPAKQGRKYRIGFFPGCAQDLFFADSKLATITILTENSCEVVVPGDLKCCGMPMTGYGLTKMAKKLAKHNIDIWASTDVEAIITICATCGSFMKSYGDLLSDDPQYAEPAKVFSQKIQDVSQFLVDTITLREDLGVIKERVTYHDPCHLIRGQEVSQQPRFLLQSIPGLELVEMEEADWCCGGAGTYILNEYELSTKILERKTANILATEAEIIATGCPGCQIQLGLGVKRAGLRARVVHPIQLLYEAYRREGGRGVSSDTTTVATDMYSPDLHL